MAIDGVDQQGSPGWWFKRLAKAHRDRYDRLTKLWDRFQGRPPLPELPNPTADWQRQRAWDAVQRRARTNYAELIVEAVRERMTPVDFTVADNDELGVRSREFWTANEMAVEFPDILEQMLALSVSYGIVGPPPAGSAIPVITGEDPREVITIQDPVRRSEALAGLKVFYDEVEEHDVAYLYLPGENGSGAKVYRANRTGSGSILGKGFIFSPQAWTFDEQATITLPIDDLPVVEFRNRRGVGEFENHVDHLDRINHTILNRMTITLMQAFKQRALKGAPERDPTTGQKIDYNQVLPADPAALWLLPSSVDIWESGQTDLSPILAAVRDDVKDLSAVTRVPVSYFIPDAASGSAEGASLTREGLVFRTEDRSVRAGAAAARLQSKALRMTDPSARAGTLVVATQWAPIERLSLAERYSAAVQAVTAGVPWETRMRAVLGYTPEEVETMRRQRAEDMLYSAPDTSGAADAQRGVPSAAGRSATGTAGTTGSTGSTGSAGSTGTDAPASGTSTS